MLPTCVSNTLKRLAHKLARMAPLLALIGLVVTNGAF